MKIISIFLLAPIFLVGCASVKMESNETSEKIKKFETPASGNSGLYIFRDSNLGAALKKDIWVDGKCIGESAPKVFFHTEVTGGKEHVIATESEFSPNEISLFFEAGKNYFVRQFVKLGVFVGGAGLEVVSEEEGKAAISKLGLAAPGTCSKQ